MKKEIILRSQQIIENLQKENEELKGLVETYKNQDVLKDINFLKNTVNNKEFEVSNFIVNIFFIVFIKIATF